MMEYSAGLTSQLFWLQEARKTASLMEEGKEKVNIRETVPGGRKSGDQEAASSSFSRVMFFSHFRL